jgi:hypothetical protein
MCAEEIQMKWEMIHMSTPILCTVRFVSCVAQYSGRDFFGIRVGIIECDKYFGGYN